MKKQLTAKEKSLRLILYSLVPLIFIVYTLLNPIHEEYQIVLLLAYIAVVMFWAGAYTEYREGDKKKEKLKVSEK